MWVLSKARGDGLQPVPWSYKYLGADLYGCRKTNLGPLEEKHMLLSPLRHIFSSSPMFYQEFSFGPPTSPMSQHGYFSTNYEYLA